MHRLYIWKMWGLNASREDQKSLPLRQRNHFLSRNWRFEGSASPAFQTVAELHTASTFCASRLRCGRLPLLNVPVVYLNGQWLHVADLRPEELWRKIKHAGLTVGWRRGISPVKFYLLHSTIWLVLTALRRGSSVESPGSGLNSLLDIFEMLPLFVPISSACCKFSVNFNRPGWFWSRFVFCEGETR